MIDLPVCGHRGRVLSGGRKCFCRLLGPGRTVPLTQCAGCPHADPHARTPVPSSAVALPLPPAPACVHRSADPLRTVGCRTCGNAFSVPRIGVYDCAEFGEEVTLFMAEIPLAQPGGQVMHGPLRNCATCKARQVPQSIAIAVGVICHNYGRYLAEAVESVLTQTLQPVEVLIVDDASDDDTLAVAQAFADRGVRYVRIDARSVWEARRTALRETSAEWLCCLDADNWLPADFLEAAAGTIAKDWRTGIVYVDLQKFGAALPPATDRTTFPPTATAEDLARRNVIDASAVVRREALEISGAFDDAPVTSAFADWRLWRRVLQDGWRAVKSPALLQYRVHESNMLAAAADEPWSVRHAQELETITLLVPLSGRYATWPALAAFLERQTWPHDRLQLVLADTSQDPTFGAMVRQWAAGCDYPDVRVMRFAAARPGLADEARRREIQTDIDHALCRIWARLTRELSTRWTWTLEDDVIPPDDVLQRLLGSFAPDVDAVHAPYRHRCHEGWAVLRDLTGDGCRERGAGVERVRACGFGCTVWWSETLRSHAWGLHGGQWYDVVLCDRQRLHVLCDWDCEAEHLIERDPEPPPAYQSFRDRLGASDSPGKWAALLLRPEDVEGRDCLDVGCNEGFHAGELLALGARRVVGLDTHSGFLAAARRRFPAAAFHQVDWDRWLAATPERFDLVLWTSAMHYAQDTAATLARIRRVLKPGGRLVLECGIAESHAWRPTARWIYVDRGSSRVRHPTRALLDQLLQGFAVRYVGESVSQKSDPIMRHVLHCVPRQPVAWLLGGRSRDGKSSAPRQFTCPVYGIDDLLVSLGKYASTIPWPQDLKPHGVGIMAAYHAIERDPDLAGRLATMIAETVPPGDVAIEANCVLWPTIGAALEAEFRARGYRVWKGERSADRTDDHSSRMSSVGVQPQPGQCSQTATHGLPSG